MGFGKTAEHFSPSWAQYYHFIPVAVNIRLMVVEEIDFTADRNSCLGYAIIVQYLLFRILLFYY